MAGRREVFLAQAESAEGRSPLYARLCRELADDRRVDALVGSEPRWDAPLRLLGALHALVLERRASWEKIGAALDEHGELLARAVVERPVQTNEVQRCWVLLPCFLEVARRTSVETLDLIELGASAGLNLVWDRYRYRYEGGGWGGGGGGGLELRGEERRPVPADLLAVRPRVRGRVGVDLQPVDVTGDEGAVLLKSFVWPDQTWRLELLDRAIETLRRDPPELVRGDLVEELPRLLERRRDDGLTVVWQTAALGYVPAEGRDRVREALESAGAEGPLAWVTAGRPAAEPEHHWGLRIRLWPGGERTRVAHADFHGSWLEWLA